MTAPGYFHDNVGAARHRVVGIAVASRRAIRSCARLSRRNARVWEVRWADGTGPRIVKLACGRSSTETRQAAAALSREVQVVRALRGAGLVSHRILDYGRERGVQPVTWTMADRARGCRASALIRSACHGDADVLDLCARVVRRVALQHRMDPGVLNGIEPADRSRLDRPTYGPPSRQAVAVMAALRRLRTQATKLVLCHGDLSMHNVLVSAADVSFVDWAGARAELPSLDLAPLFVWFTHHVADHEAGRQLVRIASAEYDNLPDPFLGLAQHVARVLIQWGAWRGSGYVAAANRVLRAVTVEDVVRTLADELSGLRRTATHAA